MNTARMIVDRDYTVTRTDYTDVPYLNAVPVLNSDGHITVFAVNRSMD